MKNIIKIAFVAGLACLAMSACSKQEPPKTDPEPAEAPAEEAVAPAYTRVIVGL